MFRMEIGEIVVDICRTGKTPVTPGPDLTTLPPRSLSVVGACRTYQNRSSIFCGRIVIVSERGAVTMSVESVVKF